MKYKNNLPKLVFMCSNNHLYAIESNEQRETIFKKDANYTNGTRKIKQSEEERTKIKATELFICDSFTGFYKLYDDVKAAQQPGKNYEITMSNYGDCNSIFLGEIKKGNIYNGSVSISKDNHIR